jgi:hypothetical protein
VTVGPVNLLTSRVRQDPMPMLPKLEGMRQLGEEQGAEGAETKEAKELRQSLDELR